MLTKLKLAIALCGSLAGGVAVAGGFHGGAARADILSKYDTNKDGKLDDSEKAVMKADFQAKHEQKKAEMLAKFDTNKDGKLDDSEKAVMRDARATEAFSKLDANKDGQISLDEFKAGRASMGEHRHARGRFHHGMRKGVSKG
jgi:5-hydroxyisourate hydrolase-like protein (transthyretin family)